MFGQPMFDLRDAAGAMAELTACRSTFPMHYIRVNAFDATRGWEAVRLSFIANRPRDEPGFRLRRTEVEGRVQRYSIEPYATTMPEGRRYR
jgi:ribulose-bisphosphate carboxylase small chain